MSGGQERQDPLGDPVETVPALVVGGGVGGLNAARTLTELGVPALLLEARARCGGLVFGAKLGEVWVDLGAESFAKRSVYTADLCRSLGLEVMDPSGQSWIWSHHDGGHAFAIPHGVLGVPTSLDDPDVIAALSPEGLERAREDLTLHPEVGSDALDLASLVEARLGREVLDRLVTPVAGGVHSAHPSRLAADTVAPGLRDALAREGSLVRAAAAQRAAAPPGSVVSSVRGGLFRLADALVDRIHAGGGDVLTQKVVTRLARDGDHWLVTVENRRPAAQPWLPGEPDGEPFTLRTPLLVVAADGRAALDLLRGVPDLGIGDWELPRGADLAQVTIAVEHPGLDAGPRGSGLLVTPPAPGDEPRVQAKALTHYSIKWPWVVADQPVHVLRVSYGRAGDPTPEPTLAQALADASVLLGVDLTVEHVRGTTTIRYANSLPPQSPAHRARVAQLQAVVDQLPGFAITGAWFAGTGLAAVLPHGEAVARRLVERSVKEDTA